MKLSFAEPDDAAAAPPWEDHWTPSMKYRSEALRSPVKADTNLVQLVQRQAWIARSTVTTGTDKANLNALARDFGRLQARHVADSIVSDLNKIADLVREETVSYLTYPTPRLGSVLRRSSPLAAEVAAIAHDVEGRLAALPRLLGEETIVRAVRGISGNSMLSSAITTNRKFVQHVETAYRTELFDITQTVQRLGLRLESLSLNNGTRGWLAVAIANELTNELGIASSSAASVDSAFLMKAGIINPQLILLAVIDSWATKAVIDARTKAVDTAVGSESWLGRAANALAPRLPNTSWEILLDGFLASAHSRAIDGLAPLGPHNAAAAATAMAEYARETWALPSDHFNDCLAAFITQEGGPAEGTQMRIDLRLLRASTFVSQLTDAVSASGSAQTARTILRTEARNIAFFVDPVNRETVARLNADRLKRFCGSPNGDQIISKLVAAMKSDAPPVSEAWQVLSASSAIEPATVGLYELRNVLEAMGVKPMQQSATAIEF